MSKKPTHITLDPNSREKLSAAFSAHELTCKCGSCPVSFIALELILKLQKLREEYGAPITVTSGYRCPAHNAKIGGAKASQHMLGTAVDITGHDLDKLYDLCEKHFNSVGDGRPKGFIHVDLRTDRRRWTY